MVDDGDVSLDGRCWICRVGAMEHRTRFVGNVGLIMLALDLFRAQRCVSPALKQSGVGSMGSVGFEVVGVVRMVMLAAKPSLLGQWFLLVLFLLVLL